MMNANGLAAADHQPPGSHAVELVPDHLHVVGGKLPLDGRTSWTPASATGYQPSNTYVRMGEEPLLIDPGIRYVRDAVMWGLQRLLSEDSKPLVFLTRAQFDCVGNLGEIRSVYDVRSIFTGGLPNAFDQFDQVTSDHSAGAKPAIVERSPEESALEVYNPALRILTTSWGYDGKSKTLFTSDAFSHASVRSLGDQPVVDSSTPDATTVDAVRAHLHATFWWLPYADKRPIVADIETFFTDHDVNIVAPSRGCVLVGRDVVHRHVDMVLDVLGEEPKDALCR